MKIKSISLSRYILAFFVVTISCFSCTKKNDSGPYFASQEMTTRWITEYSKYPDSYTPLSFDEYSNAYTSNGDGKIPNSDNYEWLHTGEILDVDSQLVRFTYSFVFNHKLQMVLIEENRSNYLPSGPIQIDEWMLRFGRELTAKEKEARNYRLNAKRMIRDYKNQLQSNKPAAKSEQEKQLKREIITFLDKVLK